MKVQNYFYNCSPEFIYSIDKNLFLEIIQIISKLSKRNTQKEINFDFFWLLTRKGWSYDTLPASLTDTIQKNSNSIKLSEVKKNNKRSLCKTSSTIAAKWSADFAKLYDNKLVQIEVQFGKIESMFKDFCGFKIAFFEKRLTLGIEIVLCEPNKYFSHRKETISGMANFEIAKNTLPAIGLNCPIWLVGIYE